MVFVESKGIMDANITGASLCLNLNEYSYEISSFLECFCIIHPIPLLPMDKIWFI